jgi:hypothetical protein
VLLVTFHGGSPTKKIRDPINNVWAYDEEHPSHPALKNILNPQKETLRELRGLTLANGYLYVVNGSKDQSNVLCFSPDLQGPLSYTFESVFIISSLSIDHPFSCTYRLVPDPDLPNSMYQFWYVSNQDTNIVAALVANEPYTATQSGNGTGSAFVLALQAALQQVKSPIGKAGLLPGTFVPTAKTGGEIPNQIVVPPEWGGLTRTLSSLDDEGRATGNEHHKPKQKVQNSVRDLVIANGVLYVADEAGNAVRMYDPATGVPWGSTQIPSPIHLVVQSGNIYIGSQGSVFSGPLVAPPQDRPVSPPPNQFAGGSVPPPYPTPPSSYTNSVALTLQDLNLTVPKNSAVSGMTFDDSGNLYVALRNKMAIYQFQPNPNGGNPPFVSGTNPLIHGLQDEPEFLLWLPS